MYTIIINNDNNSDNDDDNNNYIFNPMRLRKIQRKSLLSTVWESV